MGIPLLVLEHMASKVASDLQIRMQFLDS